MAKSRERELNETVQDITAQLKKIEKRISSISKIPDEDTLYSEIRKLTEEIGVLKSRQEKIEAAMPTNPAQALEIPLLMRELAEIKLSQKENVASLKESVDRIYDFNKLLLGTMAISMITLALGNLFKPRESKPRTAPYLSWSPPSLPPLQPGKGGVED